MSLRRTQGFTLVEILTVIAIITVLAGLSFASITVARRFATQKACTQEILALAAGIDRYKTEFGDYPPSSLGALKLKSNGINEGNEALVLCLSSQKKGGPFHETFKEDRLANGDKDRMSAKELAALRRDLALAQTSDQLFEYVDTWGNPFVYIHYRDYIAKKIEYTDREGQKVLVQPARSQKLGTYQSPTSYQIWSFGPNGVNENGDGDDVASWK